MVRPHKKKKTKLFLVPPSSLVGAASLFFFFFFFYKNADNALEIELKTFKNWDATFLFKGFLHMKYV